MANKTTINIGHVENVNLFGTKEEPHGIKPINQTGDYTDGYHDPTDEELAELY